MKILPKYILIFLFFIILIPSVRAQYDRDIFLIRGRQALSEGKYATAIQNLNILMRIDTLNHLAPFYRGIAKYNLGDVRGAKYDFDRCILLNPIFTPAYHYRSITKGRMGQYDKALKDIDVAIALRPDYDALYYSRGLNYFLSRNFDKSIQDFNKYIRKEGDDASAYINRGTCYLFKGDTTLALNDYNKAIELDGFDSESYLRRANLFFAKKDYKHALVDLNYALDLDSNNTLALFNRALCGFETMDYNRSLKDFSKIIKLDPNNALTLFNRSLLYARFGEISKALDDMDRVIEINPGNVLAYFNRASFYIQEKEWAKALDDYNKAISLYPDFAKAYINRSYVNNMLGNNELAKKDYKTAQTKIKKYREGGLVNELADTSKTFSSLLSLDADFAKKDFNKELLQYSAVDIRLLPIYRFTVSDNHKEDNLLSFSYKNTLLALFEKQLGVEITNNTSAKDSAKIDRMLNTNLTNAERQFLLALKDVADKSYNEAVRNYDDAINGIVNNKLDSLYKGFYYLNKSVILSDIAEFMASLENNNVKVLSLNEKSSYKARVENRVISRADYNNAIDAIKKSIEILPNIPYSHFNLGNLYCLSSNFIESINEYSKALEIYPLMGDAYYNRGLVLIYLKDKEKGCIDLSKAGELGVKQAYRVISKYCKEENN